MSSEKNRLELPRFCPLCNTEIECVECYEIGMVAEGAFPKSELPSGLELTEERAKQCLACEEHVI